MEPFAPTTFRLHDVLTLIDSGQLALPDFQRDFVWDPGATSELIQSIVRQYPVGSLLFLKHKGDGFQIREFEAAPKLNMTIGAGFLVLDGQQRLTSLYQAFFGKGDHRYFLDLNNLLANGEIEEAIWYENLKKYEKQNLKSIEVQSKSLICPLEVIMNKGFDSWIDQILDCRETKGEDVKTLRSTLREVSRNLIQPILSYPFPVITLDEKIPLDAVCKMFETLNRRGVKLTVFELLMARSFANKVSLRNLWDETLEKHSLFEDFGIDPYYVLQVISLLAGGTIKRKDVLELDPKVITEHWKSATDALAEAIIYLRRNAGVLSAGLLPYNTMLVPMAAAWAATSSLKGPQQAARNKKIEQWFWGSVFSQAYEKGPSSRAVSDFKELKLWIEGGDNEPYGLRALFFVPEMFYEITPKQRALYNGILSLVVSNGALDFHKSEKLTFDYLIQNKVEDHHIFPQNYIRKNGGAKNVNSILNRTLIDGKTNNLIRDKAPSKYLKEIEKEVGVKELKRILESHLISMNCLMDNDFESFLKARANAFMEKLREKIGREIPTAPTLFSQNTNEIEEDDVKSDPRERYDASEINAVPTELLKGLPSETEELFSHFTKSLLKKYENIWWASNSRRVVFRSPGRAFLTARLSKTGMHFIVFTDGKPISGVEPIKQKDHGGKLWGRLKLKSVADISACMEIISLSHKLIEEAVRDGRATSWWAAARAKRAGNDAA